MIIRQQAFDGTEKQLKGGLHCHTTRSDGQVSPEETIRLHVKNGYDFLAITDHRKYNYENFAPETNITIIPGMEFDNGRLPCDIGFRCFHTVCIGPSAEDGNGYAQDQTFARASANTQEEYQVYLDEIHANNNMTIYCHPEWSSTPARYFEKLQGNFAMEIWNSGCVQVCDMDDDAAYWDELLGQGIRIYGVATDDGHELEHHCCGWVMVRAENNVNAILKALKDGAFYSSCGPEIYDFRIEDGKVILDCSPVARVRLQSDAHPTRTLTDRDGNLTHAEFELDNWCGPYAYVRMTVIDKEGKFAWTNPIFLK
ncbi:MAG: CehA/McbA family metallohydrolase [Clostridia bacterium]|nr:CehA/McbA family metallohydrolase [Clostridia bacterium]